MPKPKTIPKNPKKMIAEVVAQDPKLGPWIQAVGKFPLPTQEADFDLLCRSVIGQSISVQAAATIAKRIRSELSRSKKLNPNQILKSSETELRKLGLSQTKANALLSLAEIWKQQKLKDSDLAQMPDGEVMDLLTPVRGIGPWTVKMLLIFGLRRPDVFPRRRPWSQAGDSKAGGLERQADTKKMHRKIRDLEAISFNPNHLHVADFAARKSKIPRKHGLVGQKLILLK